MAHIRADKSLCEGRFFQDPVSRSVRCAVCQDPWKQEAAATTNPRALVANQAGLKSMLQRGQQKREDVAAGVVSKDPAVTRQFEGNQDGIRMMLEKEKDRRGGAPVPLTVPPIPLAPVQSAQPTAEVAKAASVPNAVPVIPMPTNIPLSGKERVAAAAAFDAKAPPVDPASLPPISPVPLLQPTPGASASPLLAAMQQGAALGEQSKAK